MKVPQNERGGKKRNRRCGKISSTCLRWKLVDLKRWRGAGVGGARVTGGRKRGLSLTPRFVERKNKNAADRTRKPGDARMSTNPVLIGS